MRGEFLAVAAVIAVSTFAGSARAADDPATSCRNMYELHHADVDGPVLSVYDHGKNAAGIGRYHIVIRDRFTNCRVSDDTDTECKVGQHAAIVGGGFGLWAGDVKDTDTDYPYEGTHIWDCGS